MNKIWKKKKKKKNSVGNSLAVQWLGLGVFTAVGPGLISVRELRSQKLLFMGQKESFK